MDSPCCGGCTSWILLSCGGCGFCIFLVGGSGFWIFMDCPPLISMVASMDSMVDKSVLKRFSAALIFLTEDHLRWLYTCHLEHLSGYTSFYIISSLGF